jgi:hypothetical protein
MDKKMKELGDVKFVINLGDSFYPKGVKSKQDRQWDGSWRNIYSKELRSVPWYSVYGNHDLLEDPCACSRNTQDCAQVNGNESNLDFFFMPHTSYFREHPDLGLEVIALDLNRYVQGNKHKTPYFIQCKHTQCEADCYDIQHIRAEESFRLFHERAAISPAPNLVVFSHYPTDYFSAAPDFMAGLRNSSKHHIEYFGGHRHNVDQTSTASTAPNNNWLVGGGGGSNCDGEQQGFVVMEIGLFFDITTYPVLVDHSACCGR